jgi:hypothetical protein
MAPVAGLGPAIRLPVQLQSGKCIAGPGANGGFGSTVYRFDLLFATWGVSGTR